MTAKNKVISTQKVNLVQAAINLIYDGEEWLVATSLQTASRVLDAPLKHGFKYTRNGFVEEVNDGFWSWFAEADEKTWKQATAWFGYGPRGRIKRILALELYLQALLSGDEA